MKYPLRRQNLNHSGGASRRLVQKILSVLLVSAAGCSGPNDAPRRPIALPEAVLPTAGSSFQRLQERIHMCPLQAPRKEAAVSELVVSFINSGRDFREPAGPDGYVLRVIPLSAKNETVKKPMAITVFLYAWPEGPVDFQQLRPVQTWHIAAETALEYWRPSILLDGFLLRLDWGDREITAEGTSLFLVHVAYPHKQKILEICQTLRFEPQASI